MLPESRSPQALSRVSTRIVAVAALVFATFLGMEATRDRWAVTTRDAAHPYAIRFEEGPIRYVWPGLGWFLDHAILMVVILFTTGVVLEWISRWTRTRKANEG